MSFFTNLLRKIPPLNPISSLFYVLTLAYVPHFMKVVTIAARNKKVKGDNVADSRYISDKSMDNTTEGKYIARCYGAHVNGLEAFGYYSVAILASLHAGVDDALVGGAATAFVGVRALYNLIYLSPLNGALRSFVFVTGLAISTCLFSVAGNKYSDKKA